MSDAPLIYAHIGDLHIASDHQQNVRDLASIAAELSSPFGRLVDFVYLPGDIADGGRAEEYAVVARELACLPMPVHVIAGDHDVAGGTLAALYGGLGADILPKSFHVKGYHCLCLDLSGPGSGGPDFRMGAQQLAWLEHGLTDATAHDRRSLVFMHTYPADLRGDGEAEAVRDLLRAAKVLLVDMGHTHYNELANDGTTIFAATRSTGQVEEGPVGYSLICVDRNCVSWHFRELDRTSPQVLITAPVDRRLATDLADPDHLPTDNRCELRVSVLANAPVTRCDYRVNGGETFSMTRVGDDRFVAPCTLPGGSTRLTVEASLEDGTTGSEYIDVAQAIDFQKQTRGDGSDADRIGAWADRGIVGSQLGPNRNGRQW